MTLCAFLFFIILISVLTSMWCCRYVDDNKKRFIDVLREAVAIQSVSAWPEKRQEIVRQMEWAKAKLEALGATCALNDIGEQVTEGLLVLFPLNAVNLKL